MRKKDKKHEHKSRKSKPTAGVKAVGACVSDGDDNVRVLVAGSWSEECMCLCV